MNGEDRLFLEVRPSARGMAWRHRLSGRQEAIALAIAQGNGVSDIVARVLAARGVTVGECREIPRSDDPRAAAGPASLTDMDKAAARIADAIVRARARGDLRRLRRRRRGGFGADEAVSRAFRVPAEIYIPDRIFEGYGPNPEAMRDLVGRGATLIVTVDCGTNSAASIDAARQAGADVVVLDHHQVGGAAAARRRGRQSQSRGRPVRAGPSLRGRRDFSDAGAGRARAAPARHRPPPPDLLGYLDLVALATVCDVVPLTGVNRAFVVKGLLAIRKQQNAGLAALARVSRIGEPVNAFHLAFLIGPRINAGGRIGDAALGSRLLATDDPVEAGTIAETLDRLNQERQAMEQDMLAEARAEADVELAGGAGPAIIVTASDKWHPGIVGLLASRLKDHARRPAFAIAFNPNGVGTGSGRSVSGFDLGRLVRDAADEGLIVKGGGHAMAAGITIERSRLGELRAFFEEGAASEVSRLRDEESLEIDAALSAEGATLALVDALEAAGPYGAGHPPPLLALPRHKLLDARIGRHRAHPRRLQSASGGRLQAMAFRAVDTALGDFLVKKQGRARFTSRDRCRSTTGTAAGPCNSASSTRRSPVARQRSGQHGLQAHEVGDLGLGCLVADLDRLVGAVEFRQADVTELRLQRHVGRIAGKPRARDAVLDDVEGLDHDAGDAEARLARCADRWSIAGRGILLDDQIAGAVLDHRGAAIEVVVQVDGHHQRLLVGAADRDRDRIDERAIDQYAAVADHRFEHAGQRIGGAHGGDQRPARQPDLVAGADFGSDADERLVEILEGIPFICSCMRCVSLMPPNRPLPPNASRAGRTCAAW